MLRTFPDQALRLVHGQPASFPLWLLGALDLFQVAPAAHIGMLKYGRYRRVDLPIDRAWRGLWFDDARCPVNRRLIDMSQLSISEVLD
ncbi:hypothetical protein ACN6KF_002999 [Labrys sp. La1]|uniref:hypothetical protein n=1 Tax=Labrys sp. La1 TaxID=3404917 RepID=UPI003EBF0F43